MSHHVITSQCHWRGPSSSSSHSTFPFVAAGRGERKRKAEDESREAEPYSPRRQRRPDAYVVLPHIGCSVPDVRHGHALTLLGAGIAHPGGVWYVVCGVWCSGTTALRIADYVVGVADYVVGVVAWWRVVAPGGLGLGLAGGLARGLWGVLSTKGAYPRSSSSLYVYSQL